MKMIFDEQEEDKTWHGDLREEERNSWVLWLVGFAGLLVMIFAVGMLVFIARQRFTNRTVDDGTVTSGRQVVQDDSGPTPQQELVVPTLQPTLPPDTTATPEPTADDAAVSGLAPTATLANSETGAVSAVQSTQEPAQLPTQPPLTAPIATATLPPGGSVTAFQVDTPFVIDGSLENWGAIQTFPATYRIYTVPGWDGTDDVDGFWRLAWDATNLYVGVQVIDDVHVQNSTGNQIFRGDSLEMQLDVERDVDYGPGLSPDDYQIVLSPGDFRGSPAASWRYRASNVGQSYDAPDERIQVASQRNDEGYTLEAAIPWATLGVTPADGFVMGVSLNVNDNDSEGTARQEMMKSHVSTRQFANPNTWGLLILSE